MNKYESNNNCGSKSHTFTCEDNNSRFQVTFQSVVGKFVLNIPNYITKFGILRATSSAKFSSC